MSELLLKSDDEIREWWGSLSNGQREEVSFYADDAVWSRIVAAVGRGAR